MLTQNELETKKEKQFHIPCLFETQSPTEQPCKHKLCLFKEITEWLFLEIIGCVYL